MVTDFVLTSGNRNGYYRPPGEARGYVGLLPIKIWRCFALSLTSGNVETQLYSSPLATTVSGITTRDYESLPLRLMLMTCRNTVLAIQIENLSSIEHRIFPLLIPLLILFPLPGGPRYGGRRGPAACGKSSYGESAATTRHFPTSHLFLCHHGPQKEDIAFHDLSLLII